MVQMGNKQKQTWSCSKEIEVASHKLQLILRTDAKITLKLKSKLEKIMKI